MMSRRKGTVFFVNILVIMDQLNPLKSVRCGEVKATIPISCFPSQANSWRTSAAAWAFGLSECRKFRPRAKGGRHANRICLESLNFKLNCTVCSSKSLQNRFFWNLLNMLMLKKTLMIHVSDAKSSSMLFNFEIWCVWWKKSTICGCFSL